ncbi:MAG: hypothetical protein SNJ60_08815, partial [Pseudanabaenaceae cyanobacterium]
MSAQDSQRLVQRFQEAGALPTPATVFWCEGSPPAATQPIENLEVWRPRIDFAWVGNRLEPVRRFLPRGRIDFIQGDGWNSATIQELRQHRYECFAILAT